MEKIFQFVAVEVVLFRYVYLCINLGELSVHRAFLSVAAYYKHSTPRGIFLLKTH